MISAWKRDHPEVQITVRTIRTKNGFNTRIWVETVRAVTYRETTSMKIIEDKELVAILDEMYQELKESEVN